MTNKNKTTLYVGVTNNLRRRVYEHKNHLIKNSFTDRYNLEILVYYSFYQSIKDAIREEKRIKAGSRAKKIALIESINKEWRDLYNDIKDW